MERLMARKEYNIKFAIFLCGGYLLNVLIMWLAGDFILEYQGIGVAPTDGVAWWMIEDASYLPPIGGLSASHLNIRLWMLVIIVVLIICGILTYCISSTKGLLALTLTSATLLSLSIIAIIRMTEDSFEYYADFDETKLVLIREYTGQDLVVFWIMIIVFVLFILACSLKLPNFFLEYKYYYGLTIFFISLYTLITYYYTKRILVPLFAYILILCNIINRWKKVDQKREDVTYYNILVETCKTFNLVAIGLSLIGMGKNYKTTLR